MSTPEPPTERLSMRMTPDEKRQVAQLAVWLSQQRGYPVTLSDAIRFAVSTVTPGSLQEAISLPTPLPTNDRF